MTSNKPSTDALELSKQHPIVFFDGVCGLCNGVVDWLLVHDKSAKFRFTPLQGETAARTLTASDVTNLSTIILLKNGVFYRKSTAALMIFGEGGALRSLLSKLLLLIPHALRDFVYDQIASRRYGWFGQRETCRLPTPEERARFLD